MPLMMQQGVAAEQVERLKSEQFEKDAAVKAV